MKDLGGWSAHPRAVRPAWQTADLPPGYPQEYCRLVTLRDGRRVLIRPVLPSDAPALAESVGIWFIAEGLVEIVGGFMQRHADSKSQASDGQPAPSW